MAWLSGWTYRKTVSITGQTGAGTDYQVDFSIGDGSGGDFNLESHCTSFPNDIQVTDNDQTTTLDHWVEDLTVDPITMWVEVADDLGSNVDVCIYYSKSGEGSASNGDNTFSFFDDFPGTSVDTNKWTGDTAYASVSGSYLTISGTGILWKKIYSQNSYTPNMALRTKAELGIQGCIVGYEKTPCCSGRAIIYDTGLITCNDADTPQTTTGHWSFDTEYIFDVLHVSGTSVELIVDGTSKVTHTIRVGTIAEPVSVGAQKTGAGNVTIVDWVFTREYISGEPAFSSAGSEETEPTVGHPTMARWHGIPSMNYTGRRGGW